MPIDVKCLSDEQRKRVAARRAACATCDLNHGLKQFTVKCDTGCWCNAVSLLNGACKLGKWATPEPSRVQSSQNEDGTIETCP